MHAWEAIQETIDHIEAHLADELMIDVLAQSVGLSTFYYQRLFTRLVKKPVNEYIKLRRLAMSSERLLQHHQNIMEVALAFGFSTHGNFTRAFKQVYGITPEDYRNHPRVLNHFLKPDLHLHYLAFEENNPIITDGITLEIGRETFEKSLHLVGIRGSIPIDELQIGRVPGVSKAGELWNEYHVIKNDSPEFVDGGVEAAALTLQPDQNGNCSYFVGGETAVEGLQNIFENEIISPGEYVVCKFEAQDFLELINTAVFKATTFMQKWNQTHHLIGGEFAYEIYAPQEEDVFHMSLMFPIMQAP